jgi:ribosome-binding factor A
MSRSQHGARSQRQHRVGELLRHAIAEVLSRGDLRDPDLQGVSVTVTEVTVSPDLRNATAWVMPLGGQATESVEAALNRCARYVRGQVSHMVHLRYAPQIRFATDSSFDAADRIKTILEEPAVKQDLGDKDSHQPEQD